MHPWTFLLFASLFGTAPGARADELKRVLVEAIGDRSVPAMAAIEIRDFEVAAEAEHGVRRLGARDRVAVGDSWHLGSNSKAMTATLIARLVDAGTLSWSLRLDQTLPELASSMHPAYRDVTLLDLLAHLSGLPENVQDLSYLHSFHDDDRSLADQRYAYVARALSELPVAGKRTAKRYSNTGYLLAAVLAERATGRSYEDLMQTEVFAPLGMLSASFAEPTAGEPVGHVDGHPADTRDANPPMFSPAGQARMSLADWARFCIDQMQGDRSRGRLLHPQTYRLLHTPRVDGAALGWGVSPSLLGRLGPAYTHTGSDGNWYAIAVLFPESGNGLLVAANAAEGMGADKAIVQVLRRRVPALAPAAAAEIRPQAAVE